MQALKKVISLAPSPLADRSPDSRYRPPLILGPKHSLAGSHEKLQDSKFAIKKLSPSFMVHSNNRNPNSVNVQRIIDRKDVSMSNKLLESIPRQIDDHSKSRYLLKNSMNSSKFLPMKENIRPFSPNRESTINFRAFPGTSKHGALKHSQLYYNDISDKYVPMSPSNKVQKEPFVFSKDNFRAHQSSLVKTFVSKGSRGDSRELGLAKDEQLTSQFFKSRAQLKLGRIVSVKSRSIGKKKTSVPDTRSPDTKHAPTRSSDCKSFKNCLIMDKSNANASFKKLVQNSSTMIQKPRNPFIEALKKRIDTNEDVKSIANSIKEAFKNWRSNDSSEKSDFKTTIAFYRIQRQIGKGCFGIVYLATQRLTGIPVALKTIPKKTLTHSDAAVKIEKEFTILKRINNHPSVVKLFEVFEDAENVHMVFELLEQGDLAHYFKNEPLFSEQRLKPFFHKIIKGVAYLHKNSVVHRDIKLDNILLDHSLHPKLCDFGISSLVVSGQRIFDTGGTPAYLAPEVIRAEGKVGPKSDMWSLGVLLYLLTFGNVPFKANDMQVLYKKILIGIDAFPEEHIASGELVDLIKKLMVVDVGKRLDVQEALKHPWFADLTESNQRKSKKSTFLTESNSEEIMGFLTHVGFPAAYVELTWSKGLFNHAKACFDSMTTKFETMS
jgi:serine/threonine protein kinase